MNRRVYFYCMLAVCCIVAGSKFLMQASQKEGPLYPEMLSEQEQADIRAAQLASVESLKEEGKRALAALPEPSAPSAAAVGVAPRVSTPSAPSAQTPPPPYEAPAAQPTPAPKSQYPTATAQRYPTSSAQPAASATTTPAPLSASQRALQAAAVKRLTWTEYFTQKTQAAWATIKRWFGW